jgi:hypothetical protein
MPWPLLERAGLVLALTDTTLPAVHATAVGARVLAEDLAHTGPRQRLAVVPVTGPGRYTRDEVVRAVTPLKVLPALARDDKGATALHRRGSRYATSVRALAAAAVQHHAHLQGLLTGGRIS